MTVTDNATAFVRAPEDSAACDGAAADVGWETRYAASTVTVDTLAGAVAGAIALVGRFGVEPATNGTYSRISLLVPLAWVASLWLARAHEARFLAGAEEFRRVIQAGVWLTAAVGFAAFAAKQDVARGYVVLAIPTAMGASLVGRYTMRSVLYRKRQQGLCQHRVVAVGHAAQVLDLMRRTRQERCHGMNVVGVCVPNDEQMSLATNDNVRVLGDLAAVSDAVWRTKADAVAVTSCPELTGDALRRLSWELERTGTDLIVAPGLVEVTGPRLHLRPVSGLPLLHVEHPTLSGGRQLLKQGLDRLAALLLLVAFAPILLALAVTIRMTSSGPAVFRQTRVGRDGREFPLFKLRTMVANADAQRKELLHLNQSDGPLFKLHSDPRVTPLGGWLRRYSIDELPQLLNVLRGEMSLVGPRPPLPEEAAAYGDDVRRRLRVKPGLTGLWQISGRSDLNWEESVLLDLRYVENWSIALDLVILWRTLSVVLRGRGAY